MYTKNKPETIQSMFSSIAKTYDRTNALLSFQMHRYWNRQLVKLVVASQPPESYLDLCCGTGEIALTYLRKAKLPCHAHLLDFSEQMIACAKSKLKQLPLNSHQLNYHIADAQLIPLLSESVDCATVAYGIRNVQDPRKCMQEAFRVLRPGGRFGILELTEPSNPIMRFGHHLYLNAMVPLLGWYVSANIEAYNYLKSSIQTFTKPMELMQMLEETGFEQVTWTSLSGGVASILFAKKPF